MGLERHLKLSILVGAESKKWLEDATKLVERLEKATGGSKKKAAEDDEDDEDEAPKKKKKAADDEDDEDEDDGDTGSSDEDDEDEAPAKKKKKASSDDDEDDEDEAPKKKKKKAADEDEEEDEDEGGKVTLEDVVEACNKAAGRENRAAVLKVLKKEFKVKSVTDLKPKQYADAVKAVKAI